MTTRHTVAGIVEVLILLSAGHVLAAEPLDVPITVKECAGVGAKEYPVTVVVPLERGRYTDPAKFRLVDAAGARVPAQIDALNRWWVDPDESIRHLVVHFQPSVAAFKGAGTGTAAYHLRDDGPAAKAKTPVTVKDGTDAITVVTGPLKFVVKKKRFNILDRVWHDTNGDGKFTDDEEIVSPSDKNGGVFRDRFGVQHDTAREDVLLEIEETGPMRAVIRAEAVTRYQDEKHHTHGWAVRIYAYAGKPFVKIDYQLQNSSKDFMWTGPMFFESMDLDFKLNLAKDAKAAIGLGNGKVYTGLASAAPLLAQEFHDKFNIYDSSKKSLAGGNTPDGFLDVSDAKRGVTAAVRYFWEMWPNGLAIDKDNKLSVQLFPDFSAMYYYNWRERDRTKRKYQLSPTGLYWLDDMRHVVKEVMLHFHGPKTRPKELIALARTFDEHPVATVPTGWYAVTRATLREDGYVPYTKRITDKDRRKPFYTRRDFISRSPFHYAFNWNNFHQAFLKRRWMVNAHGDWPRAVVALVATENPQDYWRAERLALGELNCRPQWMAQYVHDRDYAKLLLDQAPYRQDLPTLWRHFAGFRKTNPPWFSNALKTKYLPGTGLTAGAKDDQHAWHYHVEEAYYFTADPWTRDWYTFCKEYRRDKLEAKARWIEVGGRATGHSLAHALQAYHVTGDTKIIPLVRRHLVRSYRETVGPYPDRIRGIGAQGYFTRMMITFMQDVERSDPQAWAEAFCCLAHLVECNVGYANFDYNYATPDKPGAASSTGQHFAETEAWYYWNTGKKYVLDHLNKFLDGTLTAGGRRRPYVTFDKWAGDFDGRLGHYVRHTKREDTTPPPAIKDLKAVRDGQTIKLTWTAPADADRYLIVWNDKPISEKLTTDEKLSNWWAGYVMGLTGRHSGATIKLDDPMRSACRGIRLRHPRVSKPAPPLSGPVYVAVFTFDQIRNISAMSNVAELKLLAPR